MIIDPNTPASAAKSCGGMRSTSADASPPPEMPNGFERAVVGNVDINAFKKKISHAQDTKPSLNRTAFID
jgi:hypothetical protein